MYTLCIHIPFYYFRSTIQYFSYWMFYLFIFIFQVQTKALKSVQNFRTDTNFAACLPFVRQPSQHWGKTFECVLKNVLLIHPVNEVYSLLFSFSIFSYNLNEFLLILQKSDEVVRAKQDVCDKVMCSKRTDDEIKSLRKQLTSQTSIVDQLSSSKQELMQRIEKCEASLEERQRKLQEMTRVLAQEREMNERVRQENEALKLDNELLREVSEIKS